MTLAGRAIGLFVLCVLVGLFLERLGITAQGMLNDTWHTIGALGGRIAALLTWSLPYALLGALIVVPLFLLNLLANYRRGRRKS
ncbi:MAG TPA: DUF6460 domain-containing protein [Stellaceae bacterium]|jgi:hypothetical protein|nr:DUF6460 domain-containing protein [Stellaceae bacterium]